MARNEGKAGYKISKRDTISIVIGIPILIGLIAWSYEHESSFSFFLGILAMITCVSVVYFLQKRAKSHS